MRDKKRVLFVAESATLCHVTRPLCLADGLKDAEIHFACQNDLRNSYQKTTRSLILIVAERSILSNLKQGTPAFSIDTLRQYCIDDLELNRQSESRSGRGDLRLSLSVSARARNVPYWSIVNAYWSPFANKQRWVVPDIP